MSVPATAHRVPPPEAAIFGSIPQMLALAKHTLPPDVWEYVQGASSGEVNRRVC